MKTAEKPKKKSQTASNKEFLVKPVFNDLTASSNGIRRGCEQCLNSHWDGVHVFRGHEQVNAKFQ